MSENVGGSAATAGATRQNERVFLRQSTGLVRLMGTGDSVIYGAMISTLLLGAALTYLVVPYAFPGANQWLGIVITGCYYGYNATGGPVGVGKATAKSAIINLIIVSAVGAIFQQLFFGGFLRAPIAK